METLEEIFKRIDAIQNQKQLKEELKLMWRFIRAGIVAEPKGKD
jgi:hypothetical protein